jgi:hypothetical protein
MFLKLVNILYIVKSYHCFQLLIRVFPRSCNWTKAKSDTAHAQSFDVACTRDRFSLFLLKEHGKPLYFVVQMTHIQWEFIAS